MCVVSMVGDHYRDKFQPRPWYSPNWNEIPQSIQGVSRKEFEELREEVKEMKELLKRAKQYDIDNNEPDCEIEDKMTLLKKIAEAVGIDLNDINLNG